MLNRPVSIGGAVVMAGDVILADDSGVLVLRADEAEAVARQALERQKRGEGRQAEMRAGRRIGEMSGATAKVLAATGGA
jgi:regulator of RNase E activity RraA